MCVLPMRIRRTKTDKDRINLDKKTVTVIGAGLSLIHISEPTRP